MRKSGPERRAARKAKARERVVRTRWQRAYCKVYGPPSSCAAMTWWIMSRRLAARGFSPRSM